MANRLAHETSPYLLQHKDNPVDWYPWGEEALARAREEDKPILLSIGYSACHWCHVMERESFEDAQTAELMNRLFVPVKLDREERPDLDAIYMEACQAMTGSGGWPLNVFLTPEQVPFYAGTYFPPEQRGGMPSWPRVLDGRRRRLGREARGDPRRRRAHRPAAGRRRAARAVASTRSTPAHARHRRRAAAHRPRPRERRLRRRAQVPAVRRARVPAAPRRDASSSTNTLAQDGDRRHVRPGRRRLRALLGRRSAGSSPTSRRCSTTTRCSRAPTCTAGR